MAVPARINGEEEEEDEGIFEEGEEWVDLDSDVPPHLRALADAAQRGDVAALSAALDSHTGSINDPVEDGDTVLHLCCLYGYLPCVQLLLERGASLESKDEEGAIPLHDACAGGFLEIVQFIINSAGNHDFVKRMLDTTDTEGDTPLHHAARGEHLDVVNLLLSAGASPKTTNTYGKSPAELAEPGPVRRTLEAAAGNNL
ncbi:uncharacterized protein A4U43_C04F3330 [Asparagus officinalis]|uniref:Uncharacterized protein n=1 Tax=Asparagus officinalis TaxID=4686 RepID=A0A5P1EXY8_ASPOF|nr:ankyrin repeat and SOCS box protein 13-like [Asparagus officinalis]ONK70965.1 uncharacterized protein A4U43_C04F3330 [Asparagus officinalis]